MKKQYQYCPIQQLRHPRRFRSGFTRQNFAKKISGGFTLIELLVVIAVIGILAAVVLASLNSARAKARDASLKSQMAQMQRQAAIFYSTHGSFMPPSTPPDTTGAGGGDDSTAECSNPQNTQFQKFYGTVIGADRSDGIHLLIKAAQSQSASAGTRVFCAVRAESWAFAAPLHNPSPNMTGWCVDSQGQAKEINRTFNVDTESHAYLLNGNLARCP